MKITTLYIKTQAPCSFEDAYNVIFYPKMEIKVPDAIKLIRRYRHSMVGLKQLSDTEFAVSFSFSSRDILFKFREECANVMSN